MAERFRWFKFGTSSACSAIKGLRVSHSGHIREHSSLPLFEIVLFCSLVIGSDTLVLVRRSRVLWCIARLEVVVSWEAFAHEIQHPWEGDKSFKETVKRASTFPIFYFVFSPVLSSKV